MTIELNHTIVPARDPQASAHFLAEILGLGVDPRSAHFTPVTLANQVSLASSAVESPTTAIPGATRSGRSTTVRMSRAGEARTSVTPTDISWRSLPGAAPNRET
jgi:hypothetical protein